MSFPLTVAFVLGLAVHALLAGVIPSPWWVPNLSLVVLVVIVARVPNRWLILSWLAGMFMMVWTVRFPVLVFASYLFVGWAVQALSQRLDTTDPRAEWLIVGLASLCLTLGALWLESLWSVSLVGLAVVHIGLTVLAVPLTRRVVLRVL